MTTTPAMDRAVSIAEDAIGYDESRCSATIGNNTRYGIWYGMNCAAWCAMFASKCYWDAGFPQPASTAKGFAYTPSGAAWYQSQQAWAGPEVNPERGWMVFFFSESAGRIAHVGLVRGSRGSDGLIPTVEGNTNGAGSAEGGSVLAKRRNPSPALSFRIAGYGRPDLLPQPEEDILNLDQESREWIEGRMDVHTASIQRTLKQITDVLLRGHTIDPAKPIDNLYDNATKTKTTVDAIAARLEAVEADVDHLVEQTVPEPPQP